MFADESDRERHREMAYKYQTALDANIYYDTFLRNPDQEKHKMMRKVFDLFQSDIIKGDSLLDFGCGPAIYWMIAPSSKFKQITSADFVPRNRRAVQKWINGDPDALDWSFYYNMVAEFEGESDASNLEKRLRNVLKEVLPCDATRESPLTPFSRTFDAIFSAYCIECSVLTEHALQLAIRNIATLINPQGTIILVGMFGMKHFFVDNVEYPTLNLNHKMLLNAIQNGGFENIHIQTFPREDFSKPTDCSDHYLLYATKSKIE